MARGLRKHASDRATCACVLCPLSTRGKGEYERVGLPCFPPSLPPTPKTRCLRGLQNPEDFFFFRKAISAAPASAANDSNSTLSVETVGRRKKRERTMLRKSVSPTIGNGLNLALPLLRRVILPLHESCRRWNAWGRKGWGRFCKAVAFLHSSKLPFNVSAVKMTHSSS